MILENNNYEILYIAHFTQDYINISDDNSKKA